jgi:hypothetical protein
MTEPDRERFLTIPDGMAQLFVFGVFVGPFVTD